MDELAQALIAESYAAAPSHILEGLTDNLVHRELPNVPHTIYAELWHAAFWQRITLHWIADIETPYPAKPSRASARPCAAYLVGLPTDELSHRQRRWFRSRLGVRLVCTSRATRVSRVVEAAVLG